MENNSDSYSCQICCEEYNTTDRIPKVFSCGYCLCLRCMKTMPNVHKKIVCPHCRITIQLNEGINSIPTCYALLNLVEDRIIQKKQECQEHQGHKADIICIQDKCRICLSCIVYGEHKNHKTEKFADFKAQVNQKIKEFERFMKDVREWPDNVDKIYSQECKELKSEVGKKFDELIKAVKQKKRMVLQRIEQNFQTEIQKIKSPSQERTDILKSLKEVKKLIADSKGEEFKASMFAVFDEEKTRNLIYRYQQYSKDSVKDYCNKVCDTVFHVVEECNMNALRALEHFGNVKVNFSTSKVVPPKEKENIVLLSGDLLNKDPTMTMRSPHLTQEKGFLANFITKRITQATVAQNFGFKSFITLREDQLLV